MVQTAGGDTLCPDPHAALLTCWHFAKHWENAALTAEEGWLDDEGGTGGGKNQIGLPQLQLVFS